MKNEPQIKDKITYYRDIGHCDRDGNTIPKEKRGAGKGDRNRSVGLLLRSDVGFPSKILKTWPRDSKGQLIGD